MDERVAVWHPRTKVWLEGDDAPRRRELGGWLKDHPGWKPMPPSTAELVKGVVDGVPQPAKLLPDEAAATAAMARAAASPEEQASAAAATAAATERTRSPAAARAEEDAAGVAVMLSGARKSAALGCEKVRSALPVLPFQCSGPQTLVERHSATISFLPAL